MWQDSQSSGDEIQEVYTKDETNETTYTEIRAIDAPASGGRIC